MDERERERAHARTFPLRSHTHTIRPHFRTKFFRFGFLWVENTSVLRLIELRLVLCGSIRYICSLRKWKPKKVLLARRRFFPNFRRDQSFYCYRKLSGLIVFLSNWLFLLINIYLCYNTHSKQHSNGNSNSNCSAQCCVQNNCKSVFAECKNLFKNNIVAHNWMTKSEMVSSMRIYWLNSMFDHNLALSQLNSATAATAATTAAGNVWANIQCQSTKRERKNSFVNTVPYDRRRTMHTVQQTYQYREETWLTLETMRTSSTQTGKQMLNRTKGDYSLYFLRATFGCLSNLNCVHFMRDTIRAQNPILICQFNKALYLLLWESRDEVVCCWFSSLFSEYLLPLLAKFANL